MCPEKISLNRRELYERVWSIPMQKLAKEFGLSDVGLAKLCRRHKVPVPGRGYRARLAAGQTVLRAPLPAVTEPLVDKIEIQPRDAEAIESDLILENQQVSAIEVADDRPLTHPLALRIERSISRSKKERGVLLPRKERVVPIRVSLETLPRALRILDALLVALEETGHTLQWPKPYNTPFKLIILDEALDFMISEVVKAKPHTLTSQESARSWMAPRWDHEPTGRLKLSIDCNMNAHIRRSWSDGKKRRVEKSLGNFVVTLPLVAKILKKEREERAERERRWAEERKREAEAAARKAEYDRNAKIIQEFTRSWNESKHIRDFAAILRATSENPSTPDDQKTELSAMADFAIRHANYVDPLTDLKWMIRQFKNPSWQHGF